MSSEYKNIYTGSIIFVTKIKEELEKAGIVPVVKDQNESGRLAGFGQTAPGVQGVYVARAEFEKAEEILKELELD